MELYEQAHRVCETLDRCRYEAARKRSVVMKPVKRANIHLPKDWFRVLQTTARIQTAVMTLKSGKSSGEEAEAHKASDQVLLLVDGEISAVIGTKRSRMKAGDVVVIPRRVKHRFTNHGAKPAVTFSVYSPPEYSPGERE